MKALKRVGLLFLSLIILLSLISLLLPSKITVTRSVVLHASAVEVFEQVNTLKNWEKWSPWHQIDPAMLLNYEGPEAGVGAKYSWFSENSNVGNGSLIITESKPLQRIDTLIKFEGQGDGTGYYLFEETPEGTKITWTMIADMGMNPIGKYMGLMMDSMIGSDFEKGLENLRKVVEKPVAAKF
jgi:hypothetical protein